MCVFLHAYLLFIYLFLLLIEYLLYFEEAFPAIYNASPVQITFKYVRRLVWINAKLCMQSNIQTDQTRRHSFTYTNVPLMVLSWLVSKHFIYFYFSANYTKTMDTFLFLKIVIKPYKGIPTLVSCSKGSEEDQFCISTITA